MLRMIQIRGGGAIGYGLLLSWQGTWPCARIQIYPDKVTLSVWPFKSTIKIKDIDYLTTFFWSGIRINHHGPNVPYLVFLPLNMNEVVNAFRKRGIKIKN